MQKRISLARGRETILVSENLIFPAQRKDNDKCFENEREEGTK